MSSADVETLTFETGDVLIAPGGAADDAYVLLTGSVRVADDDAGTPLIVGPGAMIGDIDLLPGQPRSASAVALERVSAVRLTRSQLAAALCASPDQSAADRRTQLAGFARRVAERLGPAPDPLRWTAVPLGMPPQLRGGRDNDVRLTRRRMPFSLGRRPGRRESAPKRPVDLALDDGKPYNLSRRHFAVDVEGDRPVVRDLGSLLGTVVNGVRIGAGRPAVFAPLRPGDNLVIAGAGDSPFRFTVTVTAD